MLLDFKTTFIKSHCSGTKTYMSMEQYRSPEINEQLYDQLIYDRGGKKIQWEKNRLFTKWF